MGVHHRIDFSGGVYGPVHEAVVKVIQKVEADPYHSAQLEKMLKEIGDNARQVSFSLHDQYSFPVQAEIWQIEPVSICW